MTLQIIAIDGGVLIENADTGVSYSYPSGSTALDYNQNTITSSSLIKGAIDINDVTQVSSIDDDRTGGTGSIPVPVTVKEIYDIIAPFFFKIAVSLVPTTPTIRGIFAVTFVSDNGVDTTCTAVGHNYQIGDQVYLQDTPDWDGQHTITSISAATFTVLFTLGLGFDIEVSAQSSAAF